MLILWIVTNPRWLMVNFVHHKNITWRSLPYRTKTEQTLRLFSCCWLPSVIQANKFNKSNKPISPIRQQANKSNKPTSPTSIQVQQANKSEKVDWHKNKNSSEDWISHRANINIPPSFSCVVFQFDYDISWVW